MLFDDMFDLYFFEEYLKEKKNLAESSMHVYVKAAQQFLIEQNDVEDVDEYNKFLLNHSIKKRSTHFYSALKAYVEYKVKDPSTRTTIIENMIKPEPPSTLKKERKYLDEEQIVGIINNMTHQKHMIIALIQDLTGVRAGDVFRLKRGNIIPEIYNEEPVLRIVIEGKGNKRNVVYIHDDVVQALVIDFIIKNFLHEEYYFIEDKRVSQDDNFKTHRIYQANYRKYMRDLKRSMNIVGVSHDDFASHDYRRCYARRVWTKYKDLNVLQGLLNHANPATTLKYLKQSGLKNIDYHREMQNG
jgi:integrase